MKSSGYMLTCLSFLVALGGCTARSAVKVDAPEVNAPSTGVATVPSNGKEVFIRSITDKRVFEVKPAQASTPSLDPNADNSPEVKLRAVGRKRTRYGYATGDVTLREGQTVETLVLAYVQKAFAESGYKVLESESEVGRSTYVVEGSIEKLWTWLTPSYRGRLFSAEVLTNLTMRAPGGAVTAIVANGRSTQATPTGRDGNYVKTLERALTAYQADLMTKLQ